ncbi:hypothetical protein ACQ2H7_004874 [Candidozyma auris]
MWSSCSGQRMEAVSKVGGDPNATSVQDAVAWDSDGKRVWKNVKVKKKHITDDSAE